jgi:hypothetical protein
MRLRLTGLFAALLLVAAVAGCGGAGEKGKNSNLDRPKPAEPAAPK